MKLSNLIKAIDNMESFTLLCAFVFLIVFVFAGLPYILGAYAGLVIFPVAIGRLFYAAYTGK